MKPVFSICILTYNRSKLLNRALMSCLPLINKTIEIVVIDNASRDDTNNLMKGWSKKHPNIKYVRRKKNIGFFNNFIASFKYCRGKYVLFCGDDDLFIDAKVIKYYQKAFKKSNVGIVRCRQINIKDDQIVQSSSTPNNGKVALYKEGLDVLNPVIFDAFSLTGLAFLNNSLLRSSLTKSESMYPQVELCMKLMVTYKAAQIEKILVAIQGHDNQLNVLSYSLNKNTTNILDDLSDVYDRVRRYAKKNIFSRNVFLGHISSFLPIFFPYGCLKNGKRDTFNLIFKIVKLNLHILLSPLFYVSIIICLLPSSILRYTLQILNYIRLKRDPNFKQFAKFNELITTIST